MTGYPLHTLIFIAILTVSGPAMGSSIVHVTLFDDGAKTSMASGLGIGQPGADMTMATMHMVAVPQYVSQGGDVTFGVTNNSADTTHEMLVVKIADSRTPLPFDLSQNKVDEQKAVPLGSVSPLAPGHSGSATIRLKRGEYLLFCNEPGHYMSGMWAIFNVR